MTVAANARSAAAAQPQNRPGLTVFDRRTLWSFRRVEPHTAFRRLGSGTNVATDRRLVRIAACPSPAVHRRDCLSIPLLCEPMRRLPGDDQGWRYWLVMQAQHAVTSQTGRGSRVGSVRWRVTGRQSVSMRRRNSRDVDVAA